MKIMMKKIILLASLNLWFAYLPAQASSVVEVSIAQLIASPERFDGKLVSVVGFFQNEMEESAIYLNRDEMVQAIRKNGIWIELNSSQMQSITKLHNDYAKIEGLFSATERGHFGLWSGSIKDIKKIFRWTPPPIKRKKSLTGH
ncbi:hypothetical protein [Massilia pseudoviolaceinigra]|uniref:hypothetical protein n=1 Tax=Massilia pseudoviolaceinigra TaxID=3057165 RepID=UPI002796B3DB|nr:hypothetical protein [Massilia sp. CCM 9206]MDQ1925101.1 hypothetical protein [Massilia sp. CCM 9206]